MELTELRVTNYRALRDVTIPLSHFGCLTGENNSGKSSCLQALSLFFSGTKLAATDYFDPAQPIRISVTFTGIGDADLARLAEEHRPRVAGIVKDGRLILVRLYGSDFKSVFLYNTLTPTDQRFSDEEVASLLKGQRGGPALVTSVIAKFPELGEQIDGTMTQEAVRGKIRGLADSLPEDQKQATDLALPTGIDKSIDAMLPDTIYIPAVKDLADDVKTAETTPFGKILGILLQAVGPKLPDAQQLFEELNASLNRVLQPDGTYSDDRIDEVKLIEATVGKYVREGFADVDLRLKIPPPDLKAVFSSARLFADDGFESSIETKGDGLRRAIVFAVLRAYNELKTALPLAANAGATPAPAIDEAGQIEPAPKSYLLLFEEPELFLHPRAQHVLLEALRVFAQDQYVQVSTHSPMFLGPRETKTFVKLARRADRAVASKPFTIAQAVDVSNLDPKDEFQIICFENNNAALFAETVVLVEGDSDYILMPHIARCLNPTWDVAKVPVYFARIMGKGNIRRYRDFFERFQVRVPVIADLDLLVNGFDKLDVGTEIHAARDALLVRVDQLIEPDTARDEPTAREAGQAFGSGELKGLWRQVQERRAGQVAGTSTLEDVAEAVDAFFAWTRKGDRLAILRTCDDGQMLALKCALLAKLRAVDIYVLERGAIENYYPATVTGPDKPSRASDFCEKIASRELILDCCGEQDFERDGVAVREKEFSLIFESIFRARA